MLQPIYSSHCAAADENGGKEDNKNRFPTISRPVSVFERYKIDITNAHRGARREQRGGTRSKYPPSPCAPRTECFSPFPLLNVDCGPSLISHSASRSHAFKGARTRAHIKYVLYSRVARPKKKLNNSSSGSVIVHADRVLRADPGWGKAGCGGRGGGFPADAEIENVERESAYASEPSEMNTSARESATRPRQAAFEPRGGGSWGRRSGWGFEGHRLLSY